MYHGPHSHGVVAVIPKLACNYSLLYTVTNSAFSWSRMYYVLTGAYLNMPLKGEAIYLHSIASEVLCLCLNIKATFTCLAVLVEEGCKH